MLGVVRRVTLTAQYKGGGHMGGAAYMGAGKGTLIAGKGKKKIGVCWSVSGRCCFSLLLRVDGNIGEVKPFSPLT